MYAILKLIHMGIEMFWSTLQCFQHSIRPQCGKTTVCTSEGTSTYMCTKVVSLSHPPHTHTHPVCGSMSSVCRWTLTTYQTNTSVNFAHPGKAWLPILTWGPSLVAHMIRRISFDVNISQVTG